MSEWKVCGYAVTLWRLLLSALQSGWTSMPTLQKAFWSYVRDLFDLSWCSLDTNENKETQASARTTHKTPASSPASNGSRSTGRNKGLGKKNWKRFIAEDSSFAAARPRNSKWPTKPTDIPDGIESTRGDRHGSTLRESSSHSSVDLSDTTEASSDECGDGVDPDEFYDILKRDYVLSEAQLYDNGYPSWTFVDNEVRVKPGDWERDKYVDDSILERECSRCGNTYRLSLDGNRCDYVNPCLYHWGRALKMGEIETRYNCCNSPGTVMGCVEARCHVTDFRRRSELKQFVATPPPKSPSDQRSRKVYALDCEMLYAAWGPAVARITLVDFRGDVVFDENIRPDDPVVDCNTRFTGLQYSDIENAKYDLNTARKELFQYFINGDTILVGHALENDLKALRIVHKNVVDTALVFPHKRGLPFKRSLRQLALEHLNIYIQNSQNGHDSREDANACMQLMVRRIFGPE